MESVVALHGFACTGRMWEAVAGALDPARFALEAPDLPGHGDAAGARPVTFASCVAHVLAGAPERFVLCGYSLGGRVALHVALAAPERVERLVLVATTAGIDDPDERSERRHGDERLASEIEHAPIDDFVVRWTAQPLFAGDPEPAQRLWRADLRRNDPHGLAAALRGVGTGMMVPLWDRLGGLGMPVTVVAGSRDAKYVALGERLVAMLPAAAPLVVVDGAGHGLPREAPAAVAAAIAAAPV